MLGFSNYSTRVYIHSLLGSTIYGAFIGKVVIVRSTGFLGWALPLAGATLFSILLGLWLSSALWFLSNRGVGF